MSLLWLFENLRTEPFGAILVNSLSGKGGPTTRKKEETLASYNWLEGAQEPTIVVPGAPRQLKNWTGGKVAEDEGVVVYDLNHLKVPKCPLEPLFHSVLTQQSTANSTFDLQHYDLVTDCINLQKLFTFCKGDESCGFFRIDLERIGQTLLATRVEAQDTIQVDYLSYDQNMKRACCSALQPELESTHYKVVSYQFGELNLMVRIEVDCAEFAERDLLENGPPYDAANQEPLSLPNSTLKHVESKRCTVSNSMAVVTSPDGRGFPAFAWPLLFFSALDSVLVGWWSEQGAFKKPVIYKPADVNKLVKPLPYSTLSKLYDLLHKIIKFMRRNDESVKTSLIWRGQQFIEIYEKAPAAPGAISQTLKDHLRGAGSTTTETEEHLV